MGCALQIADASRARGAPRPVSHEKKKRLDGSGAFRIEAFALRYFNRTSTARACASSPSTLASDVIAEA